jgi:hypothetical protein
LTSAKAKKRHLILGGNALGEQTLAAHPSTAPFHLVIKRPPTPFAILSDRLVARVRRK